MSSFTKNSITFRFIRDDSINADTDDVAHISYAGKNMYNISFKAYSLKKPVVMFLDDQQTFRWVRRTIAMLECDTDPFTGVQLDVPMMPSIMLKVKNLSRDYSALLDAVEFQMDNWGNTVCTCEMSKLKKVPNAPARPLPSRSQAQAQVQDEDEDEDEDDDESYASMPPLVPVSVPALSHANRESAFRTPPRVNRHHLFFGEE